MVLFSSIVADAFYRRVISAPAGDGIEGHTDTAKEHPSSD
jgi:hypothetical protein